MVTIIWLLAVITLIFSIFPFAMTFQFWKYTRKELLNKEINQYLPKTSLIIPCKGTDLNFESNIKSFLNQDYPNYEVIFVTARDDDPAYLEIKRIIYELKNPRISIRLFVAGVEAGRGQKMTNMLKGIENVSKDTEVFAFMDADIGIYPGLLRNLVNPLQRKDVGAASGIWVFRPIDKAFGAILKFIWGSGAVLMASNKKNNLAIAAVTCIKKEVYEKAHIGKLLNTTVSDTMAITQGVRSLGLSIHFVPSALIISEDKSKFKDVLGWTNRLAIFNRVYNRSFWWKILLVYSFQNLMILIGILTLFSLKLGADSRLLLPALIMVGLMGFQILHALVTFPVIVRLLYEYPDAQKELKRLKWIICLLAPIGGFINMINSFNSLRTNIVSWRGIQYRLKSATETEVLGS